jgi:hypothetical protein
MATLFVFLAPFFVFAGALFFFAPAIIFVAQARLALIFINVGHHLPDVFVLYIGAWAGLDCNTVLLRNRNHFLALKLCGFG